MSLPGTGLVEAKCVLFTVLICSLMTLEVSQNWSGFERERFVVISLFSLNLHVRTEANDCKLKADCQAARSIFELRTSTCHYRHTKLLGVQGNDTVILCAN